MALVEPLIGHLLSKYKETVLEGLSKIRTAVEANDEQGTALATAITQQEEAMQAIRATLLKADYFVPTTQTLTVVLTHLTERGSRVALVREVLRGDCAALFRKTLATLSDASLPHVIAALQFLTAAVKDAPLLVLARLRSPADAQNNSSASIATAQRRADVPLHLAAFRLQLTYGQRRIRLVRLAFLVQLITSPMHNAVAETVCSHGVLTHLLEDAAELLREGTSAGVACSMDALRVVRERFVQSRDITSEQKRRVLLAQRNIFRLLVRALEFDPVADHAATILYAIVDETIESPADYASTRVESLEDHGMPNYLLFFLLRQLRPKASERMAELVLHILQRAPDLIRPYFIRVSGHLAEEGSAHGVAPTTARIAVLNLMTRAFLCPMPYHLAAVQVHLEPVAAKTSTFYAMCPRDVADEICPAWVAEYVHRLINGSTNLLLLTLAMQLTQAALMRAKRVLPLVLAAQQATEQKQRAAAAATAATTVAGERMSNGDRATTAAVTFSTADLAALRGSDDAEAEVWDTYNAQVRHHLQAALPSREEFWHRMTQQVHHILTSTANPASTTTTPATSNNASGGTDGAALTKVHVVAQRMLLLMKNYVDVFDVRAPWLSAVPAFLPDFKRTAQAVEGAATKGKAAAPLHPITAVLQQQNDILRPWPAASVALLCELLVASHQRRVPMVKLHHVNMSQAQGIAEWPLLLSILLWVAHHHEVSQDAAVAAQEARAVGWAAQLLLWTVHSVTIHSTCTLAEAHLWLTCLTPNTVPVFLHVLNHLLMRSLSKAADRVTHELREASSGVLVAAAQHFIDRTKEKKQQQQAKGEEDGDAATTTTAASVRGGRNGKPQRDNDKKKESVWTNLWGTHLQSALGEFERVVQRVSEQWPQRDTILREADVCLQRDNRTHRVTQQQCIDVLVLADRQRGLARASDQAATSAVQQVRAFAQSLQSPVLPRPDDEAEMALMTQLHGVAVTRGAATTPEVTLGDNACRIGAALGLVAKDASRNTSSMAAAAAPRWYAMNCVCWHVAGWLLAALDQLDKTTLHGTAATAVHRLALGLVKVVLAQRSDVETLLAAATNTHDVATVGLLVLLLACTRVFLTFKKESTLFAEADALSQDEGDALGAVCLSNYTGGLSVQDRLCYAVCLSLHYLHHSAAAAMPAECVGKADAPNLKTELEDTDDATSSKQQQQQQQQHRRRKGQRDSDNHSGSNGKDLDAEAVKERCVFYGAAVPAALAQRRFLLAGHSASAFRTAEVEMLSWHLDTLTEEDFTRMALCVSSRLHNGLLLARHGNAATSLTSPATAVMTRRAAEDVLCAVYPELQSVEDVRVVDLDRLTSHDVLDVRYLVPLVQRVSSLPSAYLEHLSTGRVIPLLLKALTSLDDELRAAAASALVSLYIPKGALRIVAGVARLKLRQLADCADAAEEPHHHHKKHRSAVATAPRVPRLPTPLAIFLITALRPLSRYEDPLHHHLIHFLLHIDAALTAPVPLVRWTTAPPLTAVSVPLMLEKQEALQQRTHKLGGGAGAANGNSSSSIAQASAADVAHELRRGTPPQLDFVLRLLRHACEVSEDGDALLASDSVSGLMLLCDLLTASDAMRAAYVRCLLDLCTRSRALTCLFAHRGNALVWTVGFLFELCKEYGVEAPYPYSGLTFSTTLRLLRVLCVGTLPSAPAPFAGDDGKRGEAEGGDEEVYVSNNSVDQLAESLRQLRGWVVAARVTARDILDAFDELIDLCDRTVRTRGVAEAAATQREEETAVAAVGQSGGHASGKRQREQEDTYDAAGVGAKDKKKKGGAPSKRVKAERV